MRDPVCLRLMPGVFAALSFPDGPGGDRKFFGESAPIFFCLDKRKRPRPVKRKPLGGKTPLRGLFAGERGSGESACPGPAATSTLRRTRSREELRPRITTAAEGGGR